MSTKDKLESRPPRSLAEIATRISSSPDQSLSLLEHVTTELAHVANAATPAEHEDAAVSKLAHFASSFLSPLPATPGSPEDKNASHLAISVLDHLTAASHTPLDDSVLLAIIPYATAVPQANAETDVISRILARQFSSRSKPDFIASLLETAIRPHLSKWSSTRLTATGRPAAYEETTSRPVDLAATPPWAADDSAMVPLFQWALDESDSTLLESHWPSFTPFLLALLDDTHTKSRVSGLQAAEVFIRKCPPRILTERGIGTVLEEAILPALQLLPSHTPEAESVQLLDGAHTALVLLARTRSIHGENLAAKRALLDKLLREVFSAYAHASEYIRVVEVLAMKTRQIIDELGIYATKHLKDIIPMLSSIMVDPFLAQQSQCLLAAVLALRSTILNCWPRVLEHYDAEILRSTIMCWLNLCDYPTKSEAADEADLRDALRSIAKLVSKGGEGSNESSLGPLSQTIEDKPELRALFH